MRTHKATVSEIVMSCAIRAGYGTVAKLSSRTGINYRTLCNRFNKGGWSLQELHAIHRYVHFSTADMAEILEGEEI